MTVDRRSDASSFGDLLRRHRLTAGLTQEDLAERAGLSARGISDLERGARTHPHRETCQLLADGLGLDGPQRSAFFAAARQGAARTHPSRPTGAERSPHASLPVPPHPLIGRTEEVATALAMLRDPARPLLTLTGAGGSGKTRLAIEVANQLRGDFPDGVVFVDLAPLADPALVPGAIAAALGIREQPGRTLTQTVGEALASRRLLLALDNFEHLLPAAIVASELLGIAPRLKILATSRARLALAAEQELPVLPLPVPDPHHPPPLEQLPRIDAVRLFIDRARGLKPDFALTEDNASSVAAICQRLDGLPLAIELAAARIKLLPPAALHARLGPSLPLLTAGARDVPERQRTLRNSIAWSYELLGENERALLRRLAVFVGGWTLEAAEWVAGDGLQVMGTGPRPAILLPPEPPSTGEGSLPPPDVLEGLAALADLSLIRLDERGPEPRYGMLETVREFALEQLRQHKSAEETIRGAHAAFYADLAIAVRPGLWAGLPAAIKRARAEEDNLRAMLAYLLDAGDAETVLRVAGSSLIEYWFAVGGRFSEGRSWLDRALRQGVGASPAARAWGLYGLAILAIFQGDVAAAGTAATECFALARTADDPFLAVRAPSVFYMAEEAAGRGAAAAPIAAEAVTAARALNDPIQLGWALLILGNAGWRTGDLAEATARLEEGLGLFRGHGSDWGQAEILTNLARVAWSEGDLKRAALRHAEALTARRVFGELVSVYDDLVGLAVIALTAGRSEAAARLLGAEESLRAFSGFAGFADTPVWRQRTQNALLYQLGDEQFARAWDAGKALSTDTAISEALALADELSLASR